MTRRAVVLAGGRGSRLAPYTTVLPKPLMPVGERPILEILLRQLGAAGFDDVTLAVGHLAHLVQAVVGDGSAHGVSVRYHEEEQALGTAGPLASIPDLDGTFLLVNGDVLTTLDFRAPIRPTRRRATPSRSRPTGAPSAPTTGSSHRTARSAPRTA